MQPGRADGLDVAVLAIDPSSPFSGGAILGDRVRMGEHALDEGVFIRSMATRGHLGGLALATPEAVRLLDDDGLRDFLGAAGIDTPRRQTLATSAAACSVTTSRVRAVHWCRSTTRVSLR